MNTDHMVFVFGSNLSGIHGAGAAKYAHQSLGFPWGIGKGLKTGYHGKKSYALPTKGINIVEMNYAEVAGSVHNFIRFAKASPGLNFQVTQVGCGLGGFTKEDIAPLFKEAPDNCFFDTEWKDLLPDTSRFWGTF